MLSLIPRKVEHPTQGQHGESSCSKSDWENQESFSDPRQQAQKEDR